MESESKLTQEDITKYNISAKICSTVYKELKKKIIYFNINMNYN